MVAGTNDAGVIRLAVEWAEAGVPAFPIAVGWDEQKQGTTKRPLTRRGHHDATTDVQELSVAFMDVTLTDDEVLGVGLVPGAAGYVVFDADVLGGKRGLDTVHEMGLPDAYRACTASGGMHFWLRKRDAGRLIGNASPWTDVDVRGDGGWVVAPGVETPWGSWLPVEDAPALADTPDVPEAIWGALRDYGGPRASATSDEVLTFLAGYANVEPCRYGQSVLDRLLEEVTAARVHEPGHHAAMRIGELMRAGCLGADAMLRLEERWLGFKPGSEAEWQRSLAAAAASDKADPPCDHRPVVWRPEAVEGGDEFGVQAVLATLSDAMLADRFLDDHRDVIRYVAKTKQFSVYDTSTGLWSDAWQADGAGDGMLDWLLKRALQRYGVEAGQRAYDTVLATLGGTVPQAEAEAEARKAQFKIENDLMSTRKARAVRAAAKAEAAGLPGIAVTTDAFDAQPYLVADPLGVVDLRTGQRGPHDPALLLTQALPVPYDPDAQAPQFMAFLEQAQPLLTMREYLQRREGAALLGKQFQHAFHIDLGDGRNGKGVFNEVVTRAMGMLAGVAPASVLLVQRNEKHEEEIARLRGLRRVWIDEARDARSLDAARVKAMSGGARRSARFMRGNTFEYYPSDTMVLSTNQMPKFQGEDSALMSRLHVVPWSVSFRGREDLTLVDRIVDQESAGVLAWMVAGAVALLAGGGRLNPPQAVVQATEEAGAEANPLQQWFKERVVVDGSGEFLNATAMADFVEWMSRNYPDHPRTDIAKFGRALRREMEACVGGPQPVYSENVKEGVKRGRGWRGAYIGAVNTGSYTGSTRVLGSDDEVF